MKETASFYVTSDNWQYDLVLIPVVNLCY